MPMVLVLIPRTDKAIFQITEIKQNIVRVETQRSKHMATQCHNCQLHGHSALNCRAQPKCVKCGENHHWSSCNKPKDEPAKCANCQGPHPSSYRGCPNYPKPRSDTHNPTSRPQFQWGNQTQTQKHTLTTVTFPEPPQQMLNTINDINTAMQTFFATMQQQFANTLMPLLSKATNPANKWIIAE